MAYSFAGRTGLEASELFFWILVDTAMEHLGVDDVVAMVAIVSGQPTIATRGKFKGAVKGTSPVSQFLSRRLDYTMPFRMPTLTGTSLKTLRITFTRNLGRFAGRAVPIVGWLYLAYDVSSIVYKSVTRYNQLATREDKLW
jgi:hypothetical protein